MWPIREFQFRKGGGELRPDWKSATHKLAGDIASPRKEQRRRMVISPLSVAVLSPCSITLNIPSIAKGDLKIWSSGNLRI